MEVVTDDDEDEYGAGATGGDETAVFASQAGVIRCHQSNAMMLLLGDDYGTLQQANDPEAEVAPT